MCQLLLSRRQPACHLSGRFIPPSLLEVPSQLIERLLTRPSVLMQLCRHHQAQQPLPADMAAALAAHYGCKYNSGLAVLGRVAAGLAEQMYGHFGGDGDNYWRGSWEAVSGLPREVASHGCLKEVRDFDRASKVPMASGAVAKAACAHGCVLHAFSLSAFNAGVLLSVCSCRCCLCWLPIMGHITAT